jgi:hypothetical protein
LTACRTLTLEARDFAELLRVLGFFSQDIKHALIALSSPLPLPLSCISFHPIREPPFFQFLKSNPQFCFRSLFAEPPTLQETCL